MSSKDLIIKTALKAFIERGYDGVTMKEIADGVSMKAASLYYYYNDKQSLFEACAEAFFARWFNWMAELHLEGAGLREVIRAICLSLGTDSEIIQYLYGARSETGQYRLILDILAVCPQTMEGMKDPNKQFHALVSAKVRDARESGEIQRDVSAETVYYLLSCLLEGSNIMRLTDGGIDGAAEGAKIAEIIWNGIRAAEG